MPLLGFKAEFAELMEYTYIPESDRDSRDPALHGAGYGWCRRCGGIIVVPKGQTKYQALRNWKRIDPDRIPEGWVHYKRASWHGWCHDHVSPLWKPNAYTLKTKVCAACKTDFEWVLECLGWGSYKNAIPWFGESPRATERFRHHSWRKKTLLQVALGHSGYDTTRDLLEGDHIVPLWAGGKHQVSNLQVLCQVCHKVKTAREAKARGKALREYREGIKQLELLGD